MRRFAIWGLAGLVALAVVPFLASGVAASDTECRGVIGPVGTGNIVVPDGAFCSLQGTQVGGNVTVKSGATLVTDGVRVAGNVLGEGAAEVRLQPGSYVAGGVELRRGGTVSIEQARIDQDLQLERSDGFVSVAGTAIGGNLQAKDNDGGTSLATNVIGNNLQCQDNDPAPVGGGNSAKQKEGQCEAL